jgi:hypothetical protein
MEIHDKKLLIRRLMEIYVKTPYADRARAVREELQRLKAALKIQSNRVQ